MSEPLRIIIVGGGISGLATAFALQKEQRAGGRALEIALFEQGLRLGGNIRTEQIEGFVIDGGPDSWVSTKPQASALARELALGDEVIPTVEANRRVYIAWNGALHPLPEGLVLGVPTRISPIVKSHLFSWAGKIRMGLEPAIPPRVWREFDDETIADFMTRRLGRELAERLVAPLLGGIFAGDAAALSIRATFPQFVEAEQRYGSLVRAMRAQKRSVASAPRAAPPSAFLSLRRGLGALIDALARAIEPTTHIATNVRVVSVGALPSDDARGRYVLMLDSGETHTADAVVLATPAHASARLLGTVDDRIAAELSNIPYVSSATTFVAFPRAEVRHALDASGFIVPRTLGRAILAGTWVSSKWPDRAPADVALMRVFFGGAHGAQTLARSDDELVRLACEELSAFMGPLPAPRFSRVFRFDRASPQPVLGHPKRMATIRALLAERPGLFIAGSGFDGVGIGDCVRQAQQIASLALAVPP